LNRKDKQGFATPEGKLASSRSVQLFIERIIKSDSFASRPYWNSHKVNDLYSKTVRNGTSGLFVGDDLWRVIILELWLRKWIDSMKSGKPKEAPKAGLNLFS
jgi:asparagine synthase (glutamine-hydrolysing)